MTITFRGSSVCRVGAVDAYGLWVPGGAYGLWVPRCADEQQFESRELFMERRKLFSRFRRCELLGSEMDILAFDILHSDV